MRSAVLGGIGILPGAVIGGFILGIVESLTRAYLSSQLADAFVFSILIIVLLFKTYWNTWKKCKGESIEWIKIKN